MRWTKTRKAGKIMYKLICMSFDGDYKVERPSFDSVDKTWNYAGDIGSKWFFYPFYFVVSGSGKTIVDAGGDLKHLIGKRVKTVVSLFEKTVNKPEMANVGADEFASAIPA